MKNLIAKSPIVYNIFAIYLFIFLPGCSLGAPVLRDSVKTYFDSEKRGDWAKVYSLRTSDFKKMVNKNDFISDMKKAANGWLILKYSIDNIRINGDRAEIKISFLEKPPAEYWVGSGMQASNISIVTSSIWIKESDGWRCKESPSRSYLPYSE